MAAMSASVRARRGNRERNFCDQMRRARRQQEHPIGEANGLLQVVGHQQRGHGLGFHQVISCSRKRRASASSSDTKGSSSIKRPGSTAKARAKATRRARPSDNSPG